MITQSTNQPALPAPTQAWRDFNHEARLALHTLLGSLQLAKQDATATQLDHLRIAERCGAVVVQLLDSFAGTAQAPNPPAAGTSAPIAHTLVLPTIPANELAKFSLLMKSGQLLKVEEWSADLGEVYPELADVADTLGYYASAADLRSLQVVLDRWQSVPA